MNPEEKQEEAPRRKKNIIRVYHAQNASDAGKRRRPAPGEKRPRPSGAAVRPGQRSAEGKAEGRLAARTLPPRPAGVKSGSPVRSEEQTPQSTAVNTPAKAEARVSAEKVQAKPAAGAAENVSAKSTVNAAPEKTAAGAAAAETVKVQGTEKKTAEVPSSGKAAVQTSAAKEEPEKTAARKTPAQAPSAVGSTAAKTAAEKSAAEKKSPEKPAAENTVQEKPAAEKAAAVKAPEKADAEKAATEKPAAEKPAAERPAAEKPAASDRQPVVRRTADSARVPAQGRAADSRGASRPARTDFRQEGRGDFRQNQRSDGRTDNHPERFDRPERRDSQRFGTGQGSRPYRQGDGFSRPARTGDGQSRPGQSRPFDNRRSDGGRPAGGRPFGSDFGASSQRGEGRSEQGGGRFGAQSRPGGARPGGVRRSAADSGFAPEMSKTGKDSRREREKEKQNKNKKDFEQNQQGQRRPNQSSRQNASRLPKALQKPAPAHHQEEKKPEVKEIVIPEKLTIRELADAMKMQPSVIVKKLFMQGIMVTVNQEIDFEKAQEIALEYDIIAEKEETVDVIEELLKEDEEEESTMVPRPPVVCVMGHVDHGKTSLLDAIRNTNVTRGEAGGITQHIGAYVVEINGQKITFLDTPGHEAFTAMRMRGANATDIAVLVVAADDGVMPQTVEAISHAKAAGVEIIVAVNKIDKPSANVERVKQEMSEYGLIPEDWGGSTIFVPVSAHTGEGIDSLLEMILLTAEVAELKANPDRAARGLVIEAQLDKGKGPVATILVQKGTLHIGDFIAAGACSGKVRAMMDDQGRRVKEAGPSMPVEILGLGDVPNAGEVLMSFSSDKEAKNFANAFVSENKNRLLEETKGKLSLDNLFDQIHASDLKELPLIVKADVQGSVEAVKQSLLKLTNDEVVVKVIHGGVGAINESDVSLAATSNAIIIGFNVRPDVTAKQLAEQEKVDMRLYKVIYQAIEDVESAMKGMLDPVYEEKIIGHAEIRQLFKASGIGTIAGSYVLDGTFQRNCKIRIFRGEDKIYEGELASLKRFKDDVKEVRAGYECGLVFDGFNEQKEEDRVEAYVMVEVPR